MCTCLHQPLPRNGVDVRHIKVSLTDIFEAQMWPVSVCIKIAIESKLQNSTGNLSSRYSLKETFVKNPQNVKDKYFGRIFKRYV